MNPRITKRLLLVAATAAVAIVAVAALNTLRQGSRQLRAEPIPPLPIDAADATARLAGSLRFRTISLDEQPDANAAQFLALHAYLQQQYPRAHAVLKREVVNDYSLLYQWPGSDPDAKPIMLMAHQDVVPIAPGTGKDWEAEPFSGAIRDGFVWGRGAWDDKGNLIAMLEAVEHLAAQGFRPRQSVYLAFGHDEEIGGARGAKAIADLLGARGVRLAFVLDEGVPITVGALSGLDAPVALIATAEKGNVTLSLRSKASGGHASAPPRHSAIGSLSRALARLEASPMPTRLEGVSAEMFDTLAPEMSGFARVALSNRWLFGPLLERQLQKSPITNAMLRSTAALTVFNAGNKRNVLPAEASALVNVRILPGDSAAAVLAHARAVVADDAVEIAFSGAPKEPTRVSRSDSAAFRHVERTLHEALPGVVVAPSLLIGGTDSRHMEPIADDVYRITPLVTRSEDLVRHHGTNERIAIDSYLTMIGFYARLLAAYDAAGAQLLTQPSR